MSETIWAWRQQLTGGVAETSVPHPHPEEQQRQPRPCPTWARLLPARGPVPRGVETMVGAIELARPSFSCQVCRVGTSPLDEPWGLRAGRMPPDVQQAAVALAPEVPEETASRLCGQRSGIPVRSERMHTFPHQVAEGLRGVAVAPAREEIARRVAQVAAGRFRRPMLVLGSDGPAGATRGVQPRGVVSPGSTASGSCLS